MITSEGESALSQDNGELERYKNAVLQDILTRSAQHLVSYIGNEKIESIVLVGSFARGEGQVIRADKAAIFLSDVEFLIVLNGAGFAKHRFNGARISADLERCLSDGGFDIKISVGLTTIKHLLSAKPYIFIIETRLFGNIVWGNKHVLDAIPNYSEKDVDPLDGFVLLNNRIVEQVECTSKVCASDAMIKYTIAKGYIQIANSILAFEKNYKSLYSQKRDAVLSILDCNPRLKANCHSLKDSITLAFDTFIDGSFDIHHKNWTRIDRVALRSHFKDVWLYEASEIMGDNGKKSLEDIFIRIPNVKNRVKGWIKYYLKGGRCIMNLRTSPQFLVYQNAIKALSNDCFDTGEFEPTIRDWNNYVK